MTSAHGDHGRRPLCPLRFLWPFNVRPSCPDAMDSAAKEHKDHKRDGCDRSPTSRPRLPTASRAGPKPKCKRSRSDPIASTLAGNPGLPHFRSMDWLANMQAWQALPPETRREQAWAQVPASVAASMAFEGEPVNQSWLEELHRRIATPGSSNPSAASSATPS